METASYTADMALDEQIGQIVVAGFDGIAPTPEIVELIRRHHLGGVILFSRNVHDAQQVLALTSQLQATARDVGHRHPLLICIDQENGVVRRLGPGTTIFPGNMALGAVGTDDVTHAVALATGRELRALGITMNLAPVVDVNSNPANPVIGVRSFGEDPYRVARLAVAAVDGYREAGVASCVKHFPGHGDTSVDSHLDLPAITHATERLEQIELVPFRAAIAAGAESVMVAHVAFPHVAGSGAQPATTSAAIVRGLLRERLGFEGVIVSDCLEMRAITATVGTARGAVLALQAGIDLVLVSHRDDRQRASIAALKAAVANGELATSAIRQAAARVLALKARLPGWDALPELAVPAWVGGDEHRHLAQTTYERSVTLVRDAAALVPLHLAPRDTVLVIYPRGGARTQVEDRPAPAEQVVAMVGRRHARVAAAPISLRPTEAELEEVLRLARGSSVILMATMNADRHPSQAEVMRRLLQSGGRVVGLATGTPYDLLVFPELGTYLATYEDTPPALEAAVRVLFGEIQARGRLPVSLPGLGLSPRASGG